MQRWAAAGAKTSRPAKVGPGRRQLVLGVGQLDGPAGAADHRHRRGEQAVVGPDEDRLAVADLDRDGPPVGADAGVDDGEHDAGAQVLGGPGQAERAGPDVVGAGCRG